MSIRILLVEDDAMISSGLQYALGKEGYDVVQKSNVASALTAIGQENFSLGILDLGLPDGSGFSVCEELHSKNIPVIILTAVDDEANTVRGFESGADDYITKPFRLKEMLLRVKAVLRRNLSDTSPVIKLNGGISIQTDKARVLRNGEDLNLTALEYRLLLVFASNRGQVLTREALLSKIWDTDGNFVEDNTLTVCIRRLREKLRCQDDSIIKTVRGMGYMLD